MAFADRARFYPRNGEEYPSVTTVLGIIDRSGPLMGWAVNMERQAMEVALLEVLSERRAAEPEWVLGELATRMKAKKAFLAVQQKALDIGTAAHELIAWNMRWMLDGARPTSPEPTGPDEALWAVMAWRDWARAVDFEPLHIEEKVYHDAHRYAGTFDWIGRVQGVLTLGDFKTSKAIYPESHLQVTAYRAAAAHCGLPTEQGMVVRLPKTATDPSPEFVVVPETPLEDFLAALRLWRWQRRAEGKPTGSAA